MIVEIQRLRILMNIQRRRRLADYAWGYFCVLPAVIIIIAFVLVPSLFALYMSFHNYNLIQQIKPFVGLGNYQELIRDPLFWKSLGNAAYFAAVVVPVQSAFALALALVVNAKIKFKGFFRTSYFIPVITSFVVASIIWRLLFNFESGLVNAILVRLGFPRQPFLSSTTQAMPTIMGLGIWKSVGFFMLVFLAGIQAIPEELHEAARIDGANTWQDIFHITLPLLRRTTLFVLVITTMDALRIFTPTYIMTRGGPRDSTRVIVFHIWEVAFRHYEMGYAAAMAFVLLVIIMVLTLLQFRFIRAEH
jgi:ABC-type sugar transport system permease subunit